MILSGEKMMFLPVLDCGSCLYRLKAKFWLLKNDRTPWIAGIRDTFEVSVGDVSGSQEQGTSPGRNSQRNRMENAILDLKKISRITQFGPVVQQKTQSYKALCRGLRLGKGWEC